MEIHQFVSNFCFADAISNNVRAIKDLLVSSGFKSEIYTQYPDQYSLNECKFFNEYQGDKGNVVIMHGSTFSEVHDFIRKLPDKKLLIYHNITPPEFFKGYSDFFVNHLQKARNQLAKLNNVYDLALGVSLFNKNELDKLGFMNTDVFPVIVNFEKNQNMIEDDSIKQSAKDFKTILFVGRFAPNKKQEDIVKAFYIYNKYFEKNSRLVLVGGFSGMENYFYKILELIKTLNLEAKVKITGIVSDMALMTYYKSSDLFLSMSEHEGFFVPVLEAFNFSLPVMAFDAGAVSETMNGAGVLFIEKNFEKVALKMQASIKNKGNIVLKQNEVINAYKSHNWQEDFMKLLKKM